MEYFERILLKEIKKWMDRKEILAIKGPRQSGKTTLLEILKKWLIEERKVGSDNVVFLTFEDREILEKFEGNPKDFIRSFLQNEKMRHYFLLDEVHYVRDVGQKLKLIYDLLKNVKLIITGSSSLELTGSTARYLVGRMFSFELFPLNFYEFLLAKDKRTAKIYMEKNLLVKRLLFEGKNFEIPKDDIFTDELLKFLDDFLSFGGYPEVVKADEEEVKRMVLKGIYNTYVERDIVNFLRIDDTAKFRKLLNLLSSLTGKIINYENLAVSCNSYYKEIIRLLDILEQTYIIKLLKPFCRNLITELRKNPKVYLCDCGIRNYILNNFTSISIRNDRGELAENFMFCQLNRANERYNLNFWRTASKAEIDFILSGNNIITPVEVKFEEMIKEKISKSLHSFINSYSPKFSVVATKNFWGEKKINNTTVKFIPIVYF